MRETLRRELTGIVLALLAVFVAGTLLLQAVPDDGSCWVPGGIFGPVGSCLKAGLRALVGLPAAWLFPLAAGVHALRLLGRLGSGPDRSWMIFLLGVAALLPIGIGLAVGAVPSEETARLAGLWGSFIAFYLSRFFGSAGAWFVVALLLSALMAWTLRWNPVRAIIGPSPPKAKLPDAPTLAQKLEPPPEEMPAMVGAEADAAPSPVAGERRKPRRASAVDTDVPADAKGFHGREDELPPKELITPAPPRQADEGKKELDEMGLKLMEALRTFRVDGTLVNRTTGPVVTQFEIEPSSGVKVRQFANLANDLALAMRAQSIRIVAPIPGRGAVGVEVPNPTAEVVGFRKLIESEEFKSARASLPIALGEDLEGRPIVADLAKMPHLLIAGATGSGKSVCINTLITSLVYRHTPETLRFLMVDPKMVELSVYNVLPHLRHKVVTDNRDAAAVLKWAVFEMQHRYELLAANGARNIQDFNRKVTEGAPLKNAKHKEIAFENPEYTGGIVPYIVLIIDELADLMMTVQGEVETPLAMLAQKARAIGIHLILATQRPSVNVITGLIKANFPSRIAFRVASQVDSRTILDGMGAESLLGNGDMLFIPPGKSEPARLQGAYISSEDTERLTGWYELRREQRKAAFEAQGLIVDERPSEEDIIEAIRKKEAEEAGGSDAEDLDDTDRDKLFREAAEIVIQNQHGSTSLLQRRLKVGYGRAARIIDQLHLAGILGPPDGSKPRDVLAGLADLDRIAGPRT